MIERHHERLMHGGMALEQRFDFDRENVFAAARRTCRRCGRRNNKNLRRRGGRCRRCNTSRRGSRRAFLPAGCGIRAGCRDSSAISSPSSGVAPPTSRASVPCIGHADRAGRPRPAFGMRAERNRTAFGHAVDDQRFGIREIAVAARPGVWRDDGAEPIITVRTDDMSVRPGGLSRASTIDIIVGTPEITVQW